MFFVASFAISLGPVMWVLFSEIFPTQLRGVAISFVSLVNGLVSFSVQLVFPVELATLGAAITFGLYGVFAAIGLALVMWWRISGRMVWTFRGLWNGAARLAARLCGR